MPDALPFCGFEFYTTRPRVEQDSSLGLWSKCLCVCMRMHRKCISSSLPLVCGSIFSSFHSHSGSGSLYLIQQSRFLLFFLFVLSIHASIWFGRFNVCCFSSSLFVVFFSWSRSRQIFHVLFENTWFYCRTFVKCARDSLCAVCCVALSLCLCVLMCIELIHAWTTHEWRWWKQQIEIVT